MLTLFLFSCILYLLNKQLEIDYDYRTRVEIEAR